VHGSAPDIAGRGIANPIAAIRCISLLLKYVQERGNARMVEAAIQNVLGRGIKTPDIGGKATTKEVGDAVVHELQQMKVIPKEDV
ncbi:MAG: isocitrate dehydrogenase, partial [Methanomicrobiales archaeon HGW-Methanomicrobiales-4]